MSRAIKPTKRKIAALLIEKQHIALRIAASKLNKLRDEIIVRRESASDQLKAALDLLEPPAKLVSVINKLHQLGATTKLYNDRPTVTPEGKLRYTVQISGKIDIEVNAPAHVRQLTDAIQDLNNQRQQYNDQIHKLDQARNDNNLLDVIIAKLPAQAGPHLEALQALASQVIEEELGNH